MRRTPPRDLEPVAGVVRSFLRKVIRFSSVKKNQLGLAVGKHYRLRAFDASDTHFKKSVMNWHVVLGRNVETRGGNELELDFYPYDEEEDTEGYTPITFILRRDRTNVINFDTDPATEYEASLVWTLASLRRVNND